MFRPLRAPGVAGRCALIATCAFAASVLAGRFPIANAEPSRYAATAYGAEERARELYLDGVEKLAAGHRDFARQTFEALIARYPSTSVAEDARRQLGDLYRNDASDGATGDARPALSIAPPATTGSIPAPALSDAGIVTPALRAARGSSWDQELRRNVSIQSKLRIDAGDRVFFASGSAELGSRARSALAAQAKWLVRWREFEAAIEGHADEPGTEQENIALSEQRAEAVRDRLILEGVEPSRIAVVPLGRSIPVATCADADCRAQNRRAVTLVFATGTRERLGLVAGRAPRAAEASLQVPPPGFAPAQTVEVSGPGGVSR
jgi:peptidoglycan-associated lipoprotein